jgi:hypothetical protein
MSCPNSPWSKALEWCGWACTPKDIPTDKSHDLTDPKVQEEVMNEIEDVDALLW